MTDEHPRAKKPDEDIDRTAILARRRRFILMALGGLGCQPYRPPPSPPERVETSVGPVATPVASPEPVDPLPLPPPPPSLAPLPDEQLRAILDDPALDLCVVNPFTDAQFVLSEAQQVEVVRAMVSRAERARDEGDLACALALYEEVYYRIPGKHIYAFRVGELAAEVGDCDRAQSYLRHFIVYVDYDRYAEEQERAKQLLDTLELQGCEPPPDPPDVYAQPQVCLEIAIEPEPAPPAESKQQRKQREREERKAEREQERASKIFAPRKRR